MRETAQTGMMYTYLIFGQPAAWGLLSSLGDESTGKRTYWKERQHGRTGGGDIGHQGESSMRKQDTECLMLIKKKKKGKLSGIIGHLQRGTARSHEF